LGCCLLVVAVVAALVWRQRPQAGAAELTALLCASLVWGGIYAAGLLTHEEGTRRLLERVMWVGVTTAPVAWLVFALSYTGRRRLITRRRIAGLLAVATLTAAAVFTNPIHELIWTSDEIVVTGGVAVAVQTFGPLFWPVALYNYALILAGAFLLLSLVFTAEGLYVDQSAALVVGAIVPVAANFLSVLGIAPIEGLDMTPYAVSVSGVAFGYALTRYDLFEFVPATRALGRDAVIDNMLDAVLIVDDQRRIVEVNPVAEYAFDIERDSVLGKPLEAQFDDVTLPSPGETVELTVARGNRTFEMTASPLSDWQYRTVGHLLVFRDVTERTLREQRLSVLNRVLRHNLRNQLTVVKGQAEVLAEGLEDPERQLAEDIQKAATTLNGVGEKARAIEQVIGLQTSPVEIDAADIVETVLDEYDEPGVTLQTDLPDELSLTSAHTGLLDLVVENLVENAIEHNDSDDPLVEVRLREVGDPDPRAVLVVADNGPVIPDAEREAIDAAIETPLQHSSSLGLWTVSWCVQRLGGRLTFETSEYGGNRIEVSLPVENVWTPRSHGTRRPPSQADS
jgi:signal transduction histidine kinase